MADPLKFYWPQPLTCPKCRKDTVRLSYIEADNGQAILNYACPTCDMVKAAVIDITPPERPERQGG
jgi:transcription elongation factor Elf1